MSIFQRNSALARPLGTAYRDGILGDATTDASDYPWLKFSAKTQALQTATNIALAQAGLCPLKVDGVLGPATCGARNALTADAPDGAVYDNPSTCQSFTSPNKLSAGCAAAAPVRMSTLPSSKSLAPIKPGGATLIAPKPAVSSAALWLGGGALLIGLGAYAYAKQQGKI